MQLPHQQRNLQYWHKWLKQQNIGSKLLAAEYLLLNKLNLSPLGRHAVLVGVPAQAKLLQASGMPCKTLLSYLPLSGLKTMGVQTAFHELPLTTGSVDFAILPHTLEFAQNPKLVLQEACRIVRPDGLLIVLHFNPFSAWGINKVLFKAPGITWQHQFVEGHKVNKWLQANSFHIEKEVATFFRPPVQHPGIYKKLSFLEGLAKYFTMFGGVTAYVARAKVIPLTPIKLSWKEQLAEIGLANATGNIIRR